jgi:hypothetical protein
MNWFMTDATQNSSGVGMVVAPMIKAVLSSGGTSEDDADATGTTEVITTRTATPIDTVTRAAVRRMFLTRSARGIAPHN